MKKYLFPVILLLTSFLYAETHLTISPHVGVKNGVIGEYLYRTSDDTKVSYLEWELKSLFTVGTDVTLQHNRWDITFGFNCAIPKQSGNTYDSDWLNTSDLSMQTNYSIGDNTVNSLYDFSIGTSFTFKPLPVLHITPTFNFTYAGIEMTDDTQEGWYGDKGTTNKTYDVAYSASEAIHEISLGDIRYQQYSFVTWLGATLTWLPTKNITVHITPYVAPYLFTLAYDTHYNPNGSVNRKYKDIMEGYFAACKLQAEIDYALTERFALYMTGSLANTKTIKGNTYMQFGNSYYQNLDSKAGTDRVDYSLSCGVKLTLF